MKILMLLFAFVLFSCATTKQVTQEMQENIEKQVKGRYYTVMFEQLNGQESGIVIANTTKWGKVCMLADSVHIWLDYPTFEFQQKFKVYDYKQSKARDGATLITFFIDRPEKMCYRKKDKEMPLSFCFEIRALNDIVVRVDDDGDCKGKFAL